MELLIRRAQQKQAQVGGNCWNYMGSMGIPKNGWFIMENPNLKWMIWGYPHDLGNLEKMEVCPWENPEVAGI